MAALENFRRSELERWIDRAIDLLDTMDGDPDLEDDDLEDIDEREEPNAIMMRGAGR
ncbi:hypothetical protein WMC41_00605 [Shinella yambaruensis]|uniref:hypothetical protein n=1 Tax=Shinella yambaruensis TaxID=415996 RepID=UPI003D7AEF06